MTDLQALADVLALDYLHGRWTPAATEEHRARNLALHADADSGLEQLGAGALTEQAIAEMLRPDHADGGVAAWRLAEVLLAYPAGDPEAQALVRDLLRAIAIANLPGLGPYDARYFEAPATYTGTDSGPLVFTAGGISGTRNWQLRAALQLLAVSRAVVLNPRRENFPIHGPVAAPAQIAWEYGALNAATAVLFWFPAGSVQPIALYELGAHAVRGTAIAVGADPAYERRLDVVEQLRHARLELEIHTSLPAVVRAVTALLPEAAAVAGSGRTCHR
ncbi:nucleoside 2-deoxyribosyltransferase domain-containing protein [Streptomyces noursei]|uniref:Uncharacterized protein n=1 Tax=Streptomyces noursei TaxID=1971 RepID=A0A2N8PQY2_STRNR|nr:nucleoside 2-deoxyribosyltransferase domain-containing protein [Streptomyces noursei]PNE43432.1 hypothetical protein AOB60_00380 [Streptomyces noursei]